MIKPSEYMQQHRGLPKMSRAKILFLCTHNSARSQMAEGLLRHYYDDKYEVFSAGASPTQVNPFAIKVMAEIGIDISNQRSKRIDEFQNKDINLAVTVCSPSSKIACPFCSSPILNDIPDIINKTLPKTTRFLQHGFNDPSEVDGSDEEKLTAFRRTRDDIKNWILDFFC
jgi:arsenate reductase